MFLHSWEWGITKSRTWATWCGSQNSRKQQIEGGKDPDFDVDSANTEKGRPISSFLHWIIYSLRPQFSCSHVSLNPFNLFCCGNEQQRAALLWGWEHKPPPTKTRCVTSVFGLSQRRKNGQQWNRREKASHSHSSLGVTEGRLGVRGGLHMFGIELEW